VQVKRIPWIAAALLFLAACAAAALFVDLKRYARSPSAPGSLEATVVIPPGQSFSATAAQLQQHGVIDHPLKFRLLARLHGYDRRVKAGEYSLRASLTPLEILDLLDKGIVKRHRLTVAEGLTIAQIAEVVAASGLASAAEFKALASDPGFVHRQGIPADTLEGYLFPETYLFPLGTSAEAIIGAMIQRFRTVFTAVWAERAAEIGLTEHEVVTLASIVEKETAAPSERPLIASVIHNRLKRGMRLETDPTVIYGIKNFDGNLTRRHLETPTPYNTYRIQGLPPGPIANPGRAALEAALYPARTDFLFFVSKNNGTHYFSSNLSEHNRAVETYQLRRGAPRQP
jgi:UPF0755 protein